MSARYPRVRVEFFLTAIERGSEYVGQVIMSLDGSEERVVWESDPDETPTLVYQLAEDRLARMLSASATG